MTIAQPEDHRSSTFTYTTSHGATLVLPRFDKVVTFGRARRLRKLSESEQVFTLVEEVCDEAALAVLDEMPPDEINSFFTAWQEHSGASLGESTPSST